MDPEEIEDQISDVPHAIRLPEQRIVGDVPPNPDADLDSSSWLDDVIDASRTPFVPSAGLEAGERLGRRGARAAREVVSAPGAVLSGLLDSGSFGWSDEGAGLAGFLGSLGQPEGLPGSLPNDPIDAYTATRDMARDYDRAAEERAPTAHATGEVAGMVLPAVVTGGVAVEAEAPGALAAIARGARTGAAYGALGGAGDSERQGMGLAADTIEGGGAGALGGALLSTAPAAVRHMRSRAPAAREAADLARVASLGAGTGTISRVHPAVADFLDMQGGISGQADRIRRLGLVGPADSIFSTAERTQRVLDDLIGDSGHEGSGAMAQIRRRIADEGHEVPATDITNILEQYAQHLETLPEERVYADAVRDRAARYADTYRIPMPEGVEGPAQLRAIPYRSAVHNLAQMSQTVPWTAEGLRAQTARGERHAVRSALDDWIESIIGADETDRYREGRLDYQTARAAAEVAQERVARAAASRGISLTDMMAMLSGRSIPEAAGRFFLNRGWRLHEPAVRATSAELIANLLERAPARLGPYAEILGRAAQRGREAFDAAHELLTRQDPEYARLVQTASAQEPGDDEGATADEDFADLDLQPTDEDFSDLDLQSADEVNP